MTQTEHYHLNQWDAADPVRREDFNADNARIDAALHGIQSEAAAGLQALAGSVSADLGSGGKNCRIVCGSYIGTGTYGEASPTKLSFDFCPVLIWVGNTVNTNSGVWPAVLMRGVGTCRGDTTTYGCVLNWTQTGASWWNYSSAEVQCNSENTTYRYVAVGYPL